MEHVNEWSLRSNVVGSYLSLNDNTQLGCTMTWPAEVTHQTLIDDKMKGPGALPYVLAFNYNSYVTHHVLYTFLAQITSR